jgi:hypothetical protein
LEVQNILNMKNTIICTINCNCRIASTLYTPETLFYMYF